MKDIIYKKNYYLKNNKIFPNTETIYGNTIIVESMHYCYSHAIMDFTFPLYWIIKDIINKFDINKFNIFIKFPNHKFNYRIIKDNCFINVFNELINLLEPRQIIFEHNLKNNVIFENAFCIESRGEWISSWQRGVWNCSKYYKEREFDIKDIYYNDDIIYKNLREFVLDTKNKLNIKSYNTLNNLIIIDRKNDRLFDKDKLDKIIKIIPQKINFNGIKILEDMNLKEQIELFSQNNIFIFRHGSCLINLLWIQNNSIIIDLDHQYDRPNVVKRICKLTNSNHHYLNYNKDNTEYIKLLF